MSPPSSDYEEVGSNTSEIEIRPIEKRITVEKFYKKVARIALAGLGIIAVFCIGFGSAYGLMVHQRGCKVRSPLAERLPLLQPNTFSGQAIHSTTITTIQSSLFSSSFVDPKRSTSHKKGEKKENKRFSLPLF
jgi:hypothetical protein